MTKQYEWNRSIPRKDPYLSDELLSAAVGFITNGDATSREMKDRMIVALSLDNRNDLIDVRKRLGAIESIFHLSPKRVFLVFLAFLSMSGIYIKESRDFFFSMVKVALESNIP